MGRVGRRAVLCVVMVRRWGRGPKPRDARFVASSQQGEPFGVWPESSGVSGPGHVRPGANGMAPGVRWAWRQGDIGGPPHSVPFGEGADLPWTCQGKLAAAGGGRTPRPSQDAVPADARSLGTWHPARGEFNLPRAGVTPAFSPTLPPDTKTCCLAAGQGSTGSEVCTVWARVRSGHGQQAALALPPGPSENSDEKGGAGQLLVRPSLASSGCGGPDMERSDPSSLWQW